MDWHRPQLRCLKLIDPMAEEMVLRPAKSLLKGKVKKMYDTLLLTEDDHLGPMSRGFMAATPDGQAKARQKENALAVPI
jgi:hypothetical protein